MGKASPIQQSFNAGEYSRLLYGHVQAPRRDSALKFCQNMVVVIQGPATRRGGTIHIKESKDSSKPSAVVPFEFSTTQAYILEFGDRYIRFYRNNGSILEADKIITDALQTNPVEISCTAHNFSNRDQIFIDNVLGMTELNKKFYTVSNVSPNTFELLGVDGTFFSPYASGGTVARVHEIATPYLEADLFDGNGVFQLHFAQSADVLYICHPLYAPHKLERTGHTNWTLTKIDFIDGPYLGINETSTTLQVSGTTGLVSIVASAADGINSDEGFKATDVGRLIRVEDSAASWSWIEISVFTSTTEVQGVIRGEALASTDVMSIWRLGLWSDTTGFPVSATFFQDRLCFGGGVFFPQTFVMSTSSRYENMHPTEIDGSVVNHNAIVNTLGSRGMNNIEWLADAERGLQIGTVKAEWIISASTRGEAVHQGNIKADKVSSIGSSQIQPISAFNFILHVQRARRKVFQIGYNFQEDGFRPYDLTMFADHITIDGLPSGLVDMTYQQEPSSIVWAVRQDGLLLGMTYDPTQKVVGWHRHVLGGFSDSEGLVPAKVESLAVIPKSDGSQDELWMVVKRFVNGQVRRDVEYMGRLYDSTIPQEDAIHFDSNLTYKGAPTTSVSGLGHLEGQSVGVFAEGGAHPDRVVLDGSIALNESYSTVQVGLKNTWRIHTLPLEAGAEDGTAQGKTKRIHELVVRLDNTLGIFYGPDTEHLDEVLFPLGQPMNQAPSLFSGDTTRLDWPGGYDSFSEMIFQGEDGFPATLLSIMPQVVTEDR